MRLPFKSSLVPFVILLASLVLSLIAGAYDYALSRTRARYVFALETTDAVQQIRNTFESYGTLLRSGRALFATGYPVTRRSFQDFAGSLAIRRLYPGMQGLGFTVRVSASEVAALADAQRKDGLKDFRIWPSWEREEYHSIIYLSPLDQRNRRAIGYDMFSEPVRREAMERARDTGRTSLSGRVILVQETPELGPVQSGYLLYCPVYDGGAAPPTMSERREKLHGFVYSPLRSGDMLTQATRSLDKSILQFRVYDGRSAAAENLLFDSSPGGDASRHFPHSLFKSVKTIEVFGRPWTIVFYSSGGAGQGHFGRWRWIWLGGAAISFVLFILSRAQLAAQARAERIAKDLSVAREALQGANTRLASILSSIRDGFMSFDRDWRNVYANEQAALMLRRDTTELLNKSLWQVLPELEGTPLQAQMKVAMQTRQARMIEHKLPAGRWLDARAYPSQEGLSLYFIDITDRKENEQREHDVLSVLQDAMLTPSRQEVSGLDISTVYRAAVVGSGVGGDFYDIFHPAEATVGFVIGDVEGKGIQAAADTALVKNGLRALATMDSRPDVVLERLNLVVARSAIGGLVSVFYGLLDLRTKELTFASAGHEPPIASIPGGPEAVELVSKGRVLGVADQATYELSRRQMKPGECLVMYTDGLTEARSGSDFYGSERLLEVVRQSSGSGAANITAALTRSAEEFTGGEFRDDLAIVCVCI